MVSLFKNKEWSLRADTFYMDYKIVSGSPIWRFLSHKYPCSPQLTTPHLICRWHWITSLWTCRYRFVDSSIYLDRSKEQRWFPYTAWAVFRANIHWKICFEQAHTEIPKDKVSMVSRTSIYKAEPIFSTSQNQSLACLMYPLTDEYSMDTK